MLKTQPTHARRLATQGSQMSAPNNALPSALRGPTATRRSAGQPAHQPALPSIQMTPPIFARQPVPMAPSLTPPPRNAWKLAQSTRVCSATCGRRNAFLLATWANTQTSPRAFAWIDARLLLLCFPRCPNAYASETVRLGYTLTTRRVLARAPAPTAPTPTTPQ